ncbi:MAG: AAA family ATPase [Phycisphaerae bacterium]
MYLKKITLSGFKSFADRVDFEFGRGVTCIVGPNGCGKSNVLDSFKWVLGEQSARSLRGKHMADMIFNGSSTRRSSSVAQVDLVFGNEDRAVPLDIDEIVVTRKLYRSGDSEYLLNNSSSRLKDVKELFLDTGVGVDAYSIIEQGRVDGLLQSSAAERRLIFEEAAGISKYKARKKEAQRKLERTEQNLLRIDDIIEELESQLRRVKLQAGKARNFQEYQGRLNELRASYVMAEYHKLVLAREDETKQVAELTDRITGFRTKINRLEAEESESRVRLDANAEEIAATDNRVVQAKSDLVALEERVEAASHRIEEQDAQAARIRERVGSDQDRLEHARQELNTIEQESAALEAETEQHHQRISALNDQDADLARNLTEVRASLEEEKSALLDVLRESGQAHNEIVRLNSHREGLIAQKGRLTQRANDLNEEKQAEQQKLEELQGELTDVDQKLNTLEEELAASKARAERIDSVRQRLLDQVADARQKRSALESRRELLQDLQDNMDGVGDGVRQWLETARTLEPQDNANSNATSNGDAGANQQETGPDNIGHQIGESSDDGIVTTFAPEQEQSSQEPVDRDTTTSERRSVDPLTAHLFSQPFDEAVASTEESTRPSENESDQSDDQSPSTQEFEQEQATLLGELIDAEIENATVVEAALGDRDQIIVVDSEHSLRTQKAAMGELAGRVSLISLDNVPAPFIDQDLAGSEGVRARVRDLVRVESKYNELAEYLFGTTWLVDDLDTALRLRKTVDERHRFITEDGEVVETDGRVLLGPANIATNLISRRSELREITQQVEKLDGSIETLSTRLGRTNEEVSGLEEEQQALRTRIYETNTTKVEFNALCNKIRESLERIATELPLIQGEVDMIDQQVEDVLAKVAAANEKLEGLQQENTRREKLAEEINRQLEECVVERQGVQQQLTDAKVAAGQIAEKRAAAAHTLAKTRQSIVDLEAAVASADHELQQCAAKKEDARQIIEKGRVDARETAEQLAELESEAARLRSDRQQWQLDSDGRQHEIRECRTTQETVEGDCHKREMALAETKVRIEELTRRVEQDLNIDLAEQYEAYEYEDQDWTAVEEEIATLEQKMARLGNVNLGAIDELVELEERYEFLSGQRGDLTESRKQLEQLIEKLDSESRERFGEAFKRIREQFRTLFRKLFGGGRADIVLEDPENELDTGIEIVAQPPGKELQSISLMSGGEKSMTAIALLMSIVQCSPAPFVILDEVDAALDEANNDRFNRIIQEFNDRSQFIVISHSKRTMSIADQLYGITMQEPGVSTRVSVQLTDANVA